MPPELAHRLCDTPELNAQFRQLGLSKQREYTEHIHTAKRLAIKQSRLDKICPMIIQGKGLNDKYR
jgi:uncharacterized protein YdeI (YjbR/CyaY-like superfamily)